MDELSDKTNESKTLNKTTRPIAIIQAKRARMKDEQTYFIDSEEVYNVVIVGVLRNMVRNDMFTSYKIEDQTGSMDVRIFDSPDNSNLDVKIDSYVQVHGRLRSFNNQNINIVANSVSMIRNLNQITYHTLDVILTRLTLGKAEHAAGTIEPFFKKIDNVHVAAVKKAILECSNTEHGAHIRTVIANLKERITEPQIMEIIHYLLNRGELNTVKDLHHLRLV